MPGETIQNMIDLQMQGFMTFLRRQGFIVGVDHHLRLQELLVKIGPGCQPRDLKYLLCPIFATNENQQQQFYRAYDSFFKPLQAQKTEESAPDHKAKEQDREIPQEPAKPRRWQYVLLAALMLILSALIFNILGSKPDISLPRDEKKDPAVHIPPGGKDQVKPPDQTQQGDRDNSGRKRKWTYQLSFLEKYGHIIHGVAILAPFIILFLVQAYRYNRRRLILKKQRGKKPPYVWPIQVEPPGDNLVKSETFYHSARLMRKRLKSPVQVLDVDKTVSASIEWGGFPTLRHKVLTRPPEYLLLIDLPAYRDHAAQLFDTIARCLEKEGLFVTRYFYEKDPRVCFKEPGQPRVYLSQLQARYSDRRLIIFGDGAGLLDPVSGDLNKWSDIFKGWQERAVLTPVHSKQWRMREIALAREFIILPASLRGLGALVDYFQAPVPTNRKALTNEDWHTPFVPAGTGTNIDNLEQYLGKDTFQWLCACAVWPELHWDLTLYLGSLPVMPENLISEENLLRLIGLPWFRTGSIPDHMRWELLARLDKEKDRAIRSALIDLLENNPPPEESAAYDDYRLNLVIQRWMFSRFNRKESPARLKSLKTFNEAYIEQDYTLLRYLESTPGSPLQMVLPRRLQKFFYKKGVPFFGMKTIFRVALTLIVAAAAFLFLKPAGIDMPLEVRYIKSLGNSVEKNAKGFWEADYGDGIIMVYIPACTFTMGSNEGYSNEKPPHPIYLDGYWMGKYEVTIRQYMKFVEYTKSHYPEWKEEGNEYNIDTGSKDYYKEFVSDKNCPIVGISWDDAMAYCDWLSEKKGLRFKLPTEAQWEKAARGIDRRKYPWGDQEPDETLANFGYNISKTKRVGSYPKGGSFFGLLDMAGNVWEWCYDWYDRDYYRSSPGKNPEGPKSGSFRVVRGGSWSSYAGYLRCAGRNGVGPSHRRYFVGFRLCQDN